MKIRTIGTCLAVACVLGIFAGSGCSSSSSGSSTTADPAAALGQKFTLAPNQPSAGWQLAQADAGSLDCGQPFWTGTASQWEHVVDGTAQDYIVNGCQTVVVQNLVGPNSTAGVPKAAVVRAFDFGTSADAAAMLADLNALNANAGLTPTAIPGYTVSTAFWVPTLSGINTFGYSGRYYFEVELTGYGTDTTTPPTDAASFFQVLIGKI